MTKASRSQFLYVTYIRTTPERLWSALTDIDFIRRYWFGMNVECDWQVGSSWRLLHADGYVMDSGEVIEADPPRRLVLRWRHERRPELTAEGYSQCTFEIEPAGNTAKLTIFHEIDRDNSEFIKAVSGGWPRILSNLKTLLETDELLFAA